jgi:hypothetical protein
MSVKVGALSGSDVTFLFVEEVTTLLDLLL